MPFSELSPVNPIKLPVSSDLMYETKIIQPLITDTLITLKLKEKSFLLNEITVLPNKQQLVVKNPWVIDYEITNKNIYIAYISNKGPIIEIRNFKNEILYQENSTEFSAFEKDCIGNIYLHIADTYFLIELKSFYYKIIKSYNEIEFKKIKYSCDVKIKDYQFYNYFANEKYNLIFNYNITTDNYTLINAIVDEKDIKYITDLEKENIKKLTDLKILNKKIYYYKTIGIRNNKLENNKYRLKNEINTSSLFENLIKKKKINSPIYNVNDTIYIFDNVNNILFNYLFNGNPLNKIEFIPPSLNPIFVVQDIQSLDVFYFYKLKNKINIYKYNINKNIFEFNTSVKNNIEKPIIINNKLFFIEYNSINQTKLLKTQWLN